MKISSIMKKYLPILFAILLSPMCLAQDFAVLNAVTFSTPESYKEAEESVLECTTYLLSTPLQKNNPNRQAATRFVAEWINGTPDYTFPLDQTAQEISGKNELLQGVYVAAMARYVLRNKEMADNAEEVKLQTVLRTLEYCNEPRNKVRKHKKLKEIIAIEKMGDLETYLDM